MNVPHVHLARATLTPCRPGHHRYSARRRKDEAAWRWLQACSLIGLRGPPYAAEHADVTRKLEVRAWMRRGFGFAESPPLPGA